MWPDSRASNRPALPRWQIALLVVAGLAHAASMAWPLAWGLNALGLQPGQPVWWLQLLALGVLAAVLIRCTDWRTGALTGWLFATAWLAGSFWWTFVALHTYGGLPALLGVLAVIALAGLLGLYYALVCGLFSVLAHMNRAWSALVFAALWLLAELARGQWLTGFGWGAAGYAHVDGPLAGLAPWLGMYGLCAVAAALAMAGAQVMSSASASASVGWGRRAAGLVVVLLVLAWPALYRLAQPQFSSAAGNLAVTLLQGNIPQDEKFETGSGVPQALAWYGEQLQASRTALVVAPETAIPLLPQQLPPDYWAVLKQRFATGEQAALVGLPLGDFTQGYTNSVLGFKPGQTQLWRYDKHHLVPFGEFIPPFFKWFTALMNIPLGDFNRGALAQAPFEWQGQRVAPNICYEDLFTEELGLLFANPSSAPTVLVNISNLAWFGNSLAMDQHLHISRMRALEFERPFLLATNTGITAIVNHQAQVLRSLPRNTRGVLEGEVQGRSGITPYAWWVARWGLWPLWLLALGCVVLAARRRGAEAP
jgi:apolipoprotein N-acyltransferase